MAEPRHRPLALLLAGVFLLFAGVNSARADSAIALVGDSAPGSGGGTFSSLSRPDINDLGQVAFRALVAGGTSGAGIFLETGSALISVALAGDVAPDGGGSTYFSLGEAQINNAGQVAFSAQLSGGTATWGLFLFSSGTVSAVATSQTVAPGTGGGTYSAFGERISLNDSGEIAFFGNVGGGTTTGGVFVEGGGPGRAVFLAGGAAPTGVSGTYFNFSPPSINAAGDVAVTVSIFLSPSGFTEAVVIEEGGVDRVAALRGDAAPDASPGTYSFFNFGNAPSLNAAGDLFFQASIASGTALSGVFVDSAGTDSAVVLQGDFAPAGTGGAKYFSFSFTNAQLSTNDLGDVGLRAGLNGGSVAEGMFIARVGGPDEILALPGDTAPDTGSGTYLTFTRNPSIANTGVAAFQAFITGGNTTSAIIVVPEPGAGAALAAGASLLGSSARFRRRRNFRKRV